MSLTKTVLVIGGSGLVGSYITARLRAQYKVYATYRSHPIAMEGVTFLPMAVEDRVWTKKFIRWVNPQVIVYCAGSNDRKWVEAKPDEADLAHATGVSTVAEACGILQTKVIYISNAYTFDGRRGNYHESDTALPFTTFGKLKVAGENYLKAKSLNWLIVRSSQLYGRGLPTHPGLIDVLRTRMESGQVTELSSREIQSYAPVQGLADLIAQFTESAIKNRIVHYSGLTKVSALEFGQQFAKTFQYSEALVTPPQKEDGEYEDYSLNCSMGVELMKFHPTMLSEGLAQMIRVRDRALPGGS